MPEKEKKNDIGAIWVLKSKKGTDYLSMTIKINGEDKQFVAFRNHKMKDTHPDFRIYPSTPRFEGRENKPVNETQYNDQAEPQSNFPF